MEKKSFLSAFKIYTLLICDFLMVYNIDEHLKDQAGIENTWIYCTETFTTKMSHC